MTATLIRSLCFEDGTGEMRSVLLGLMVAAALIGCGQESTPASRLGKLTSVGPVRGYRHDPSRSKFRLGTGVPVSAVDGPFDKIVGSDGVFVVHRDGLGCRGPECERAKCRTTSVSRDWERP